MQFQNTPFVLGSLLSCVCDFLQQRITRHQSFLHFCCCCKNQLTYQGLDLILLSYKRRMNRRTVESIITNSFITLIILLLILCSIYTYEESGAMTRNYRSACDESLLVHKYIVDKFYERRKNWRTSNLGSILFKNIGHDLFRHSDREKRKFLILVWRYWEAMQKLYGRSSLKSSSNKAEDYLHGCSAKNCIFTGNNSYLYSADALVVHMQRGNIPRVDFRNKNQRWVFLSDESPKNTYSLTCDRPTISSLANIFNWTMTYRSDSDIPVPYGRTVPLPAPIISNKYHENELLPDLIPNWSTKRHDVIVTVLISNCDEARITFIKHLMKYIRVHVYGKCAFEKAKRKSCPGNFYTDCKVISKYFFYLALENSNCVQYITEKAFHSAYAKGSIPIVQGPPLTDCEKLLPPNSFLHINKYKSPEELAKQMKRIISNPTLLLSYHKWRNHFKIVYEHKYLGGTSRHYCRLCEALNYNDGEVSIYDEDDLRLFLDPNITCTK